MPRRPARLRPRDRRVGGRAAVGGRCRVHDAGRGRLRRLRPIAAGSCWPWPSSRSAWSASAMIGRAPGHRPADRSAGRPTMRGGRAAIGLGLGLAIAVLGRDRGRRRRPVRRPDRDRRSRSTTRTSSPRRSPCRSAGRSPSSSANNDPIDHEWIVGDAALHERHRTGTEPVHDARPTEISIPAGTQKRTTVTFAAPRHPDSTSATCPATKPTAWSGPSRSRRAAESGKEDGPPAVPAGRSRVGVRAWSAGAAGWHLRHEDRVDDRRSPP